MTDNHLEPTETVQITVLLTGSAKQIEKVVRDITQVCGRGGARYVVGQRKPSADELKLFEGEHRL
jgi:hypothetical protein